MIGCGDVVGVPARMKSTVRSSRNAEQYLTIVLHSQHYSVIEMSGMKPDLSFVPSHLRYRKAYGRTRNLWQCPPLKMARRGFLDLLHGQCEHPIRSERADHPVGRC